MKTVTLASFRPFALTSAVAINAAMGITGTGSPPVSTSGTPGQTVFGDDLAKLDTKGADNLRMSDYWKLVSDIVDGTKAMRDGHATYLPQFPSESDPDYDFRWKNSKFTNIYRDVLENLTSKPFQQEVSLVETDETKPPESIKDFIEDVDGSGSNLTIFAADNFFNGVNNAIDWIMVDFPPADPSIRTVADEQASGRRPFWSHVLAPNVLEVRSKVINGKERLIYVRILEHEADGRYVRILRADANLAAWELYREIVTLNGTPGVQRFQFVDSGPITINVIPMTPLVTGRRRGRSWTFHPPMRDAAESQVELYQQESALKNLEILSGFPMLAGQGVSPPVTVPGAAPNTPPAKLSTGPKTVLYAPMGGDGNSGTWEILSPPADILRYHLEHVKATTEEIRELGRNPLTAQSGNLTVITAGVAAQKGNSAVQQWAFAEKNTLENALVFTCMWMNISPDEYDPEVNIFTDFEIEGQSEDVANLITMRKERQISRKTFWHEMRRRAVLSGEFNADKEEELLLEDSLSPEGEDDPSTTNNPQP